MAECEFCKKGGTNMKRCKKCEKVWCQSCAYSGKGSYPKQWSTNECPYCGSFNQIEVAKD